jgi:hypothetical protein
MPSGHCSALLHFFRETLTMTTIDRTYDRVNTSVQAKQYFAGELDHAMKYFKDNPSATGYLHLQKCMVVWQQYCQLQNDKSLHKAYMSFLDKAPSVELGKWGNMICLLTCGLDLTADELTP